MSSLFINTGFENGQYFVDLKTFIVIFIHKLAEPSSLKLKVRVVNSVPCPCVVISLDNINFETVTTVPELTKLCTWPIVFSDNYVVSGLCSVVRKICQISDKESVNKLLGFRGACLVACAETSVWTKFCEIDIAHTVNNVLSNGFIEDNSFILPHDILKYENHLSQPVRIHNIYKIAQDISNDQSIPSSKPRKDLGILHDYAEGPYISLADSILYPCFQIFFSYCHEHNLLIEQKIPLIKSWFDRLRKDSSLPNIAFSLQLSTIRCESKIIVPKIENVSLYKADPKRTISVKHTKQYKIESALKLVSPFKSDIMNNLLPFGYENKFDWEVIPLEASPRGGALPKNRADRKCEQLQNLIKATLTVVGDKKYKIVDFCSGSGHLGILVAVLLPNCKIILVENKERSLERAKETIAKLKLNNVVLVQSNLDYFVGTFNLGLALHACGVATDLVLQMCIKNRADFVCCPCCYGGIKDCHEVSYPRSAKFQNVFNNVESQYFNLAHAADQTHEQENIKTKQGYLCMDVIDTDRRWYAEDCGYKMHLGKLQPATCTNKNNLLVGIYIKNHNL